MIKPNSPLDAFLLATVFTVAVVLTALAASYIAGNIVRPPHVSRTNRMALWVALALCAWAVAIHAFRTLL